jgi:hypothetical protein
MNTINDFTPGMKVRSADEPEPGLVDRIDEDLGAVWVRFQVQGSYDHPNALVDVDPADLEILKEQS